MAANSKTFDPAYAMGADVASGEGFLARAFRRLMESQEAKGRAIAYAHLARLGHERLVELGYDNAEIRRIRSHHDTTTSYLV